MASYQNATGSVTVDLSLGKSSGDDGEDVLSGIEYLRGSEFADILTGDALANLIQGRAGNDTVNGGAGDDTLYGGYGVNSLDGGDGTDTAAYLDPIDKYLITRNGATTTVAAIGTSDVDTLVGIERIQFADTVYEIVNFNIGTDKTDTLSGTKGNDAIYASAGSDTIESNDGDDLLDGGAGADKMVGGRGNDIYIVDDAGDAVVETDNATAASDDGLLQALEPGGNVDRVVASIDYTLGQFVENLDLRGGNLKGNGNTLANTINGSDGNNLIQALGGDDRLDGGKGNDTLDGGEGNDTVVFAESFGAYSFAKDGNNTKVTHLATGEVDTLIGIERIVFGDRSYTAAALTNTGGGGSGGTGGSGSSGVTTGSASADTLTGTAGADVIDAAEGNDSLSGQDGDDWLIGGSGNDRITGGKGNDTLDGGEGVDTAVFAGTKGSYTTQSTGVHAFSVTSTSDGSDTLTGIERLEFTDARLAFDMSGNGGNAALLVGALLGKNGLKSTGTVGAVLGLLDGGQTLSELCALAVNAGITASLAGGAGNDKFAALIVKNLLGAADAGTTTLVQGLLDSGSFTQAGLLAVAATTDLNKTSVDLVGLAQTGLVFG